MKKLEEAKRNFEEYVIQYNMNEERIKRKVHHTYRELWSWRLCVGIVRKT